MRIIYRIRDGVFPYLIAVWLIAMALFESLNYAPHADAGVGTMLVSIIAAVYAAVRISFAREKRVQRAHVALLIIAILCAWYAHQIPFCPACEGVNSPLMRWLFPEWLKEGAALE